MMKGGINADRAPRGAAVSRAELQQFAAARIDDAKALLDAQRWQGAYYLSGYAVECGLKSCVLAHIETTGRIFKDKAYLQSLPKCWTHSLNELVQLAGLDGERKRDMSASPGLFTNWSIVLEWTENSRYEPKTQQDAEDIFKAITDPANGVLPWIQRHW
jgi:hypothetical protein